MAPSGSLRIPVAVLLLLLWGAPWTHGRRSDVRIITDENWRELLEGEWMIEFYAPWCPACQNLQPEWESFAEWGEDLEVNVAKVDVTEQPGLSGRFIISALPTVYHCKNGEFRRYQGPRTKKDFINFISEKEWKSIEPVSSWVGPGSVLMSSMSALFQLSMWIRCMIFVADCLCPSKRRRPQPYPSKKLLLESSQPLKKVEEEQEADEEDVSEEEPESKEGINTEFAQNAIRQRSVAPSLATDKSS
ncbi:thioredoxin-related transmembrane protein 1 isoform X2 [Sagmatias obliquidens]|uniref:thioredoxin-related transmembrane protein 1 isoform X2 n=1 Tax=Sagmatias obliquidens TaxID=3371155 RepID=UPI000952F6AD|nr:thioredoxin-related transmembrane protein 1 isoform X2 [Lagenorhynchus obliquidens]XP_030710819.1 thioredoxin-related transmembrane protein 1 isoform X2 [Globicephala melas]